MSELTADVIEILDLIDEKDLSEADYNSLVDELIDRDPDFQDLLDRFIDETSTRIPELKNLRPQAKLMRNGKIIASMYWEYIEKKLQALERDMFPSTAEEEALIEWGRAKGVTRKQKAKATGTVLIGAETAPDKTYAVSQLTIVGTVGSAEEEAYKFTVDSEVTISPGHSPSADGNYWIEANITAMEGGENWNLEAGRITELYSNNNYFTLVKQEIPTDGGFDLEPLEDFRVRVIAGGIDEQSPTDPIDWFKKKTESFTGVKEAIIIPVIYGEGTVGVIIRGTGGVVSQSTIDEVQAFFDDPAVRVFGWKAFVMPVSSQTLDIHCVVYYESADDPILQSDAYKVVEEYFANLEVGEDYTEDRLTAQIATVGANFYAVNIISPTEPIIVVDPDVLITQGILNVEVRLNGS